MSTIGKGIAEYLDWKTNHKDNERWEREKGVYHVSDGKKCIRKVYYDFMYDGSDHDLETCAKFERGHLAEEFAERVLNHRYGKENVLNPVDIAYKLDDFLIVGQTDPVILANDNAREISWCKVWNCPIEDCNHRIISTQREALWSAGKYHLNKYHLNKSRSNLPMDLIEEGFKDNKVGIAKGFEVKSKEAYNFKYILNDPSETHVMQSNGYMRALGLDKWDIWYIKFPEFHDRIHTIESDDDIWAGMKQRYKTLHAHIEDEELPPETPIASWECKEKYCPYYDRCKGGN